MIRLYISTLSSPSFRAISSVLAFIVLSGTFASAAPDAPSPMDRIVSRAVVDLLQQEHLLQHPLDNEISARWLDGFLKMLDPGKCYFYQSDIDEFKKSEQELDDQVKRGDIEFAYTVFDRYLKRVNERVSSIDKILKFPFDFTKDEIIIIDKDKLTYPKTPEEAHEKWRKRIKHELLALKADDEEMVGKKAIDKLHRRYSSFEKRMNQTSDEDLLEMYLTAMTTSFDPHTTYMSPGTLKNFQIAMRLELEGIGAQLQSEDGMTIVKKIIPGGAADKEGELKPEDKIVGVGQGTEGDFVDIVDMKLSDVVKMIRGKPDTIVRLEVLPDGGGKKKIVQITRAKIELKDSEAQSIIFEAGLKNDEKPYKIGVIKLPSFYMDMEGARRGLPNFRSTTRDVKKILEDFKAEGIDAVVLDLRSNGGGSLSEAINLTGLFIKEGPVVQVKASGVSNVYADTDPSIEWAGPLVVVISKFSASASEILAGAIQDYHRGLIVGDRSTHGKGTVQSLMDISDRYHFLRVPNAPSLGALKLTMQQFYRPNGDSTQKRGVLSDIELPSVTSHMDVSESDLDYPINFDKIEAAAHDIYAQVTQPIVKSLKENSIKRISKSEEFSKKIKRINRYEEIKDKKEVTLNEKKYLKQREELDADKEEEEKLKEMAEEDKPKIERDYYMNEVINITVDYTQLLKSAAMN